MMRRNLIISVVVGVALATAPVLAHDEDEVKEVKPKAITRGLEKIIERLENFELPIVESPRETPPSFFAGPHGEVRIHSGEITALASTTMSVKVWGLMLSVNTSGARFIPDGALASLRVGDKVNVKGTISAATGAVTASVVHALSSRRRLTDELINQINRLIERLRELQQRAGLPLTPLPTATTTP